MATNLLRSFIDFMICIVLFQHSNLDSSVVSGNIDWFLLMFHGQLKFWFYLSALKKTKGGCFPIK